MEQLKVVESARLGILLDRLAADLAARPLRDPFAPELLCVSSGSMREAVEYGLAERMGICANVSFPFPAEALDRLLAHVEGRDAAAGDAWAGERLVWTVHAALDQALRDPAVASLYAPVAGWLDGASTAGSRSTTAGGRQRRIHALAENVGGLFERYVLHRPSMVLSWARNDDVDGRGDRLAEGHRWQADLFRRAGLLLGGARPNLAERVASLAGMPAVQTVAAIERIAFVAVATMPGLFLDALRYVAGHVPVTLYLLTPSASYLGELRGARRAAIARAEVAAHPLLVAFGRPAMVLQTLCLERDLEVGGGDPDDPALPMTLLGALQSGVGRNVAPEHDERLAAAGSIAEPLLHDPEHGAASIEIHGCAGEVRQAEVLRDVLLRRLAADPTLQPRDIIVAVPDVTAWYPLLAAVLDEGSRSGAVGSDGTPPALPWRVRGVALRSVNAVAQGLLAVFAMHGSRHTLEELIAFLRLPVVGARFALTEADVLRVQELLAAAGARWGTEPADRGAAEGGPDALGTWDAAFDRLLLGVLSSDEDAAWGGVAPLVDAWADRGAVARAAAATNELRRWLAHLRAPRPIAAWIECFLGSARERGLVESLFSPSDGDVFSIGQVLDAISALRDAAAPMSDLPVAPEVIAHWLAERFERGGQAGEKLPGGVTVTSLGQARGLAPRIMVVLGADAAIFPRQGPPSAWDLIALSQRLTDLSARDDDRAVFFDLLMGARDAFIVLYDHCDPTDRSPRPMATPVADLAAAAAQLLLTPSAMPPVRLQYSAFLAAAHPLTRHAPEAFVGGSGASGVLWSHDPRQLRRARQVLQRRAGAQPRAQRGLFEADAPGAPRWFATALEHSTRHDVDSIAELLYQPARWQLRRALGLYRDELELPHDGGVLPLVFDDGGPFALRSLAVRLLGALRQVRSGARPDASPLLSAASALMQRAATGAAADLSPLAQVLGEALAAEHGLPVLRRPAQERLQRHVEAVVGPLLRWHAPADDRPAWPLLAPPDRLVEYDVPGSSDVLHARISDLDDEHCCAWLVAAQPFDRARASAWLRLLLLEVSRPDDRPWTVWFAGMTGQEGALGQGHLSLALFADAAERRAFAAAALHTAALLAATAVRRPLGLLRHTARAVVRAVLRWPPAGAPHPLTAPSPPEAVAALAELARWLRDHGVLAFLADEPRWDICPAERSELLTSGEDARMLIGAAADRDLSPYYPENVRAWGDGLPDPASLRGAVDDGAGAHVLMNALANDALPALALAEISALSAWLSTCADDEWEKLRSAAPEGAPARSSDGDDDEEDGAGLLEAERARWRQRDERKGAGLLFKRIDHGVLPGADSAQGEA